MNIRYGNGLSFALLFSVATLSSAANRPAAQTAPPEMQARVRANYIKLPLSFEENRGQSDARIKFLSQGSDYSILLAPSEVMLNVQSAGKARHRSTLRMGFVGANASPVMSGSERQSAISSYFLGNNPAKWVTGATNFARVHYGELYPGVDLVFYGSQGRLEYDFVVAPGADPKAIRLAFDGADSMRVDRAGDLVVSTAAGEVRQHKPIVYQESGGVRQTLAGRYVLEAHNRIAFEVGGYDARKPLIIDPVLNFATYLGSPGNDLYSISEAASQASYPAVALDAQGNVYVTGYNGGDATDFTGNPATLTAGLSSGFRVFVLKMSSTGGLIYAVGFGGTASSTDVGGGIAVDSFGNAYVTGFTTSPDFPITAGAPQSGFYGNSSEPNAFVTEVNAAGNGLVYSTYLGGSGSFSGRGIAVDHSGNAYVTGTAAAATGAGTTPFPLLNAISSTPSAGFLAKINAGGTTGFAYSTYLPAGIGYGVALDSNANAYITGSTGTAASPSPAQGYVLKVNTGGAVSYGPVLFGNASAQTAGFGIALDTQDNAYVTGMTSDSAFPVTSGAAQSTYGGGTYDGFALKLNSGGSLPPVYATYIGGLGSSFLPERGSGIGVDAAGNAYVSGTTQCIGFPTANPIPGARNGGPEVLMQGTVSGANATWSPTTLAGPFDQVSALAFDASGNLYAGTDALNATGGGVYKLAVGGSWSSANSGITSTTIDAIAVDPNAQATVYAAGSGQLYQTTNGGTRWTQLATSTFVVGSSAVIAIGKTNPSTVYVGSSNGLIYSTSPGTSSSWASPAVPWTGAVFALVADPNNPMAAFAGTNTGVYQTTNGGTTWAVYNTGLPSVPVTGLAINAATQTLFAASTDGVFYTPTSGANWTQANLPVQAGTPRLVAVDAGNNVYVAFDGSGMATGPNGGAGAWSLLAPGLTQNQVLALAVPPGSTNTAYAGIVAAPTAFLTEISPNGQSFLSSTCIGGADNNLGQSIAVTPGGAAYVSGVTFATNFPTTPGAVQTANAGLYDDFVLAVYANTAVTLSSSPAGASITVAGSGCAAGVYTTPASLTWNAGSSCTVSFTDPQMISGVEYEFQSSTVNGSAWSHTNPLPVSSSGSTLAINAVFGAVSGTGPSTATHFSVTAPASATAGIPIQFTVTALDAGNQTVTAYTDPVHFTSSDPAATLPGDAALTNGVGTFSASLVTVGGDTLTASDLLVPAINGTSGSIAVSQSTAGLRFVSMPPCRVVDTRDGTKPSGFGPPSLAAGATRSFAIPNGPCSIPGTAQAYSLNVTVVPSGPLSYITVWPTGQSQPLVSTLNSLDGAVQANAAVVAAGTGGAISVFATSNTNLVLDINGYFVPATDSSALGFYPMAPCRLVDTRPGAPSTIVTGSLPAGTSTTLPILSSSCHVPSAAQAYSLNFTLVPPGPVSYLTVYPTGESLPVVSTMNDLTGTVVANAAIAPAGTGGSIEAYVTQTTNLVVDINGYFAPVAEGALSLYALPPCRVLDTRTLAGVDPFAGAINVDVIGSGCGGTSAAQGYVFNATVVPPGPLGYLTLWPEGSGQPLVSTLNAEDGDITSNMAIVPTSNTEISAYASNPTNLVLDLFGYFAP
jgi:hypothetical protein